VDKSNIAVDKLFNTRWTKKSVLLNLLKTIFIHFDINKTLNNFYTFFQQNNLIFIKQLSWFSTCFVIYYYYY
jgi:hypothetical protein